MQRRFWKSLPEYRALPADYQALKQAILAQYTAPYALQRSLKLVSKTAARPMRTEGNPNQIHTTRGFGLRDCDWRKTTSSARRGGMIIFGSAYRRRRESAYTIDSSALILTVISRKRQRWRMLWMLEDVFFQRKRLIWVIQLPN